MKRRSSLFALVVIFSLAVSPLIAQHKVDGKSAHSFVKYLAAERLEGRYSGLPGGEIAAEWIAQKFKEFGLEPAGDNGTYFQNFTVSLFHVEGGVGLKVINPIKAREFVYGEDYRVTRYSGGGKVAGELVFVGYGISQPDKGFDEYQGVDVKGKIVLILSGAPQNNFTKWKEESSPSYKVKTAASHGARGVIFAPNPKQPTIRMAYVRLKKEDYRANFLVFGVGDRVLNFIFKGTGKRASNLQDEIDKEMKPRSFPTGRKAELKARITFDPERKTKNVLGKITGTHPKLKEEVIVLGGHMDHLGVSVDKEVYNGADDNASGTAVVMEVARVMKLNGLRPKRTILFAAWAAEEQGLLGSRHYAEHSVFPIEKTVLNLNMDMVGLGDGKVRFSGYYFAPEMWGEINRSLSQEELDKLVPNRGGPGGSDHTPFLTRGVPAFFLFSSGSHPNYHQPEDDSHLIKPEILGLTCQVVYQVTEAIGDMEKNFIIKDRLPRYLFRIANLVNLRSVALEDAIAQPERFVDMGIDIQLAEVNFNTFNQPPSIGDLLINQIDSAYQKLRGKEVKGAVVDEPNQIRSNVRVLKTSFLLGIGGVPVIKGDLATLRMAHKMGVRFLTLGKCDEVWVCAKRGLLEEGKKGIQTMNEIGMVIKLQDFSPQVLKQVLAEAKKPILVSKVKVLDEGKGTKIAEEDVKAIIEKKGIIALALGPDDDLEVFIKQIEYLKKIEGLDSIAIYPLWRDGAGIEDVDQLFRLTIILKEKGYKDEEIDKILAGNFQTLLQNIIAPPQAEIARRPF